MMVNPPDLVKIRRNALAIRVLTSLAKGEATTVVDACSKAGIARSTFYAILQNGAINDEYMHILQTQILVTRLLKGLALGLSVADACKEAGVARSAFYKWVEQGFIDPDILDREQTLSAVATHRQATEGYTYIVQAENGLCKIGQTQRLPVRLDRLDVKLPYDLKLVWVVKSADRVCLERELHERFADRRVRGEWFELTSDDLDSLDT